MTSFTKFLASVDSSITKECAEAQNRFLENLTNCCGMFYIRFYHKRDFVKHTGLLLEFSDGDTFSIDYGINDAGHSLLVLNLQTELQKLKFGYSKELDDAILTATLTQPAKEFIYALLMDLMDITGYPSSLKLYHVIPNEQLGANCRTAVKAMLQKIESHSANHSELIFNYNAQSKARSKIDGFQQGENLIRTAGNVAATGLAATAVAALGFLFVGLARRNT